jgi:tetratricopeptide (TPR) repeat protein
LARRPSRHKSTEQAPDAHQLAAIRRLADGGNLSGARQRTAALRQAFPGFKPLLGLAWEIEAGSGEPMRAAARALDWRRASPGSRAAAEALMLSTRQAGLAAMHARALQHLHQINGRTDAPAWPTSFPTPFGDLTLDEAERLDLSRLYLADNQPNTAAEVLAGMEHPSARNNLAVAHFASGRVAEALSVAETQWAAVPANLYALEHLLRWRCWLHGLAPCLGLAETLRQAKPLRAQDAIARVAALRFLGDDEGAAAVWADSDDADCWESADADLRALFDDLGSADGDGDPARAADSAAWFPAPWRHAVTALAVETRRAALPALQERWDALIDTCEAHADYLGRAADLGDDAVRGLALQVLRRRALQGDAAAVGQLKVLLTCRRGPDGDRSRLLQWLVAQGLHDSDAPASVWMSGRLREVCSVHLNITDEPRPSPFPPDAAALNERVLEAIARQDLSTALALAAELLQQCPDQPSAYTNLAAIKEGLEHPPAEVRELYEQAHALAPDYLFAQCGLARCMADAGELEQARTLIGHLTERADWHRSEYRSYLLTQRQIATASGEFETAHRLHETILELTRPAPD